jgi:predicted GTPase
MGYMGTRNRIVVLGNTNAGKSTFLNNLIGMGTFLNTSEARETAAFWKIKYADSDGYQLTAYRRDEDQGMKPASTISCADIGILKETI